MGAIRYEKEAKLLKTGIAAPVPLLSEKEEPIGEITIDEIRRTAEEKTCAVQKALTFIDEFIAGPMCGRCYPCSLGTEEAKIILIRLSQHLGASDESDIEGLRRIAYFMTEGSYCKKGRETGRFLSELLESAREEFRLHLSGICPKRECISSIEYVVNPDLCIACGACGNRCSYGAIRGKRAEPSEAFLPYEIKKNVCVRCGECVSACPTGAIEIISRIKEEFINT
jgi:ferredoxin